MPKLWLNKRNTILLAFGIILLWVFLTRLLAETNLARQPRHIITFCVMASIILIQGWFFGSRHEQLYQASITDWLTKLYSKEYYNEAARAALMVAKRKHTSLAVAILDVDDFKVYNDAYGHLAGDRMLKIIAAAFLANTREQDIVSRFGGDEFVFLFPCTDKQQAMQVLQRIRSTVSTNLKDTITFSIGIATYPQDGEDLADLFHTADQNMYDSKIVCHNCNCSMKRGC